MGVLTTLLKLLKPGENDYYNQQTEQADNWQKVDDYAVLTNTDKNGIWGGEYGGYIQDTSVTKVVGQRYIDQFDKKAYICRVAGSHVNTTANYEECNVVGNLKKLNKIKDTVIENVGVGLHAVKTGDIVTLTIDTGSSIWGKKQGDKLFDLRKDLAPKKLLFWNIYSKDSTPSMVCLWFDANGSAIVHTNSTVANYGSFYGTITYVV